jgi:hypothetical protein
VVREVVLSFRSASHRSKFPTILRLGPGFGLVFVYCVVKAFVNWLFEVLLSWRSACFPTEFCSGSDFVASLLLVRLVHIGNPS